MLKIYTKLDDVPEALREHYKLSDGRYVPDLSDDHPVLIHNKKLLSEKSEATEKVTELEADIEEAKRTSIPRGHVAVIKADAELLGKYKVLGEPDALTSTLTEHKTLKEESVRHAREASLRAAAKELSYNEDAFIRLPNLPDFEIREKGGKKTVIALVKDGDKITEKPATEYIEASADIAPFLPALKAAKGVTVHGSSSTEGGKGVDPFASARDFAKQWNESRPATDVAAAFGITKSA